MSRRHHRLHAPERFHERGEIGKVRHREEVQEPEIDASEKRKEGVGAKRGERVEEEEEEFFRDCSFRFFVDFEDFEKARHRASRGARHFKIRAFFVDKGHKEVTQSLKNKSCRR